MTKLNNKYFYILILIFSIIGIILSLNVGISHDEIHEKKNWEFNKNLVNKTFKNEKFEENYIDKYYGIGFHIVSQPFQILFSKLSKDHLEVSNPGILLLSKHPVVFLMFLISGIFFFKILNFLTKNSYFSYLGTFLYILYPYLLGHSFFNLKDIPFLSAWLVCTYLSFKIINIYIDKNFFSLKYVFLLSVLTAFLISIRISGVLIFLQLFITLIIFFLTYSIQKEKIKSFILTIFFYVFFTILFIIFLYPISWNNPLELFNAIKFMSNHYNDVCTMVLGKCIESKNLDPTYIPIWIILKLPIFILVGLVLLPFIEKKVMTDSKNKIFFGTLLSSAFIIPFFLIFNNVPLYNEIRQILFIVPIFFLLGLVSIYFFFKKKIYIFLTFFLFFFIYENIKMFPYQYTWFNLPTRFLDIEKNFELDYWSISGKNLALSLKKIGINQSTCIVVSPKHSVEPFLFDQKNNCYFPWGALNTNIKRPFFAIQTGKNLRTSIPYKCSIVHQEKIKLSFYKKDLVAGNLIKCD